jgi:exosome complex RNA-binding protein Rrp4
MISHCDRHITHLGDLIISYVSNISSKISLHLECYLLLQPGMVITVEPGKITNFVQYFINFDSVDYRFVHIKLNII